ncbi:MAG: hypothetical protein R3199_09355 [Gemmatimonadota bacterium]|nr:hypothetical protein [Gemmatimonadota bacterium]
MHLTCPKCGTVYDVTEYPEGHRFECQCGRELVVGEEPAAGARPGPPPTVPPPTGGPAAGPTDTGLDPGVKVLLFFLNLCFTPIVGLVWWLIIREDKPRTASEVCTWTWIPALVALVGWSLYFLFVIGLSLTGSVMHF